MLEDGDGRLGKLADKPRGSGDIEDIVEGEFLTVEFLEVVVETSVKFGFLVGVLAVTKSAGEGKVKGKRFPRRALVVQVGADSPVVGPGSGKRLHRKTRPKFRRGAPSPCAHRIQDTGIIVGIDDHGHGAVVLGAAADHGRASDVDLLDGLPEGDPLPGNGLLKRVEIHADEVDGEDAVLLGLGSMGGIIPQEQQAPMHLGVEGLHSAIHHFGKPGEIGDFQNRNAGGCDCLRRAARGD